MSLAIVGVGASYEFLWRRWALLRDTVTTHLEGGQVGSKFPQLLALGDALGVGSVRLPAEALAGELRQIREQLRGRPLSGLMLSRRTASVIYQAELEDRPLTAHELTQITPVGDATDLATYFSTILTSLEEVCLHPDADGLVEVLDG